VNVKVLAFTYEFIVKYIEEFYMKNTAASRKIYNIFFYLARLIALSIFCICIFALINAKYVFSENFFRLLKLLIPENISPQNFLNVSSTYTLFIGYLHFTSYILFYISFIIIITYLTHFFCNRKNLIIIYNIFSFFLLYASLNFIFFLGVDYLYLILILIIYFFAEVLNIYLSFNNKILKTLILIPVAGDLLLPNHIFQHITVKPCFLIRKFIIFIMTSIFVMIFLPPKIDWAIQAKKTSDRLIDGSFYTLNVDNWHNRIVTNGQFDKKLFILDADGTVSSPSHINYKGILESLVFNSMQNEYYLYDEITGVFSVLEGNNFTIKRQKQNTSNFGDPRSNTRIAFDNKSKTIALSLEKGELYILDMFTLNTLAFFKIPDRSDCIIFNNFNSSYLISYWITKPFLVEFSLKRKSLRKIHVLNMQGYLAVSEKNQEIYIPYHQCGKIYVYDAKTYKFKRNFKTQYTAKNITYDKDLNILIVLGYFTGYVDIFLMNGCDKLIFRDFVGYKLREAKFDKDKNNLYIASYYCLYKKHIDIKNLIKKYTY